MVLIPRRFALGLAALSLWIVGLAFWVASHEWFSRDDFLFLEHVQVTRPWSWLQVYLPLEQRFWPFYRPLSMETFFYWGHRCFGLDAFGFFAVSLGLHFACGPLVYRLARRLDFEPRVAAATAFLAISRPPSLTEIFYGSVFMYVGTVFFVLASALLFLAWLRSRRSAAQLGSCVALVLALGCNEAAVTTPLVLGLLALAAYRLPLSPGVALRLLRSLTPQLGVVAVYALFRLRLIAPVDNRFWEAVVQPTRYAPALGPETLRHALGLLAEVFGGTAGLVIALVLLLALAGAVAFRGGAAERSGWLLRIHLALLGWIAVLLVPFALLPQPEGRWAMNLEVPVCLLLGAWLDAFFRSSGRRAPRLFEAAVLLGLLASLPYAALRERARDPVGGPPRALVEWVAAQQPPLAHGTRLVLLYGGPGLASAEEARQLRHASYAGRALAALDPGAEWSLRFQDLAARPKRDVLRPGSVHVKLLPGFGFERAAAPTLERTLPRAATPPVRRASASRSRASSPSAAASRRAPPPSDNGSP